MVEGCGASLAKIVLSVLNVLVCAASIALIGVSGYVLKNSSDYTDLIDEHSTSLTAVCGITIAIGCFIFLVGLLGCLGAILESGCLLKAYFAFLLILVIAELVAGILAFVYKADIQDFVQRELEEKVVDFYGLPHEEGINDALDFLQTNGNCCGANNYTDYYGSEFASQPAHANESVPLSCCKEEVKGCNAANRFGEIADISKIYTKGCKNELHDILEASYFAIGLTVLALLIIQILAMCMSCCLMQSSKQSGGYEQYA